MNRFSIPRKHWKGFTTPILIGLCAMFIQTITGSHILDPLMLALAIGIVIKTFKKFDNKQKACFKTAPNILIPTGVILYGAVNLRFSELKMVEGQYIFLLFVVLLVYLISIFLLSHFFSVKENICYLIATGSTICGASAITIASKAIDAKPNEVSVSLITIYISALIGLFIVLPSVNFFFNLTNLDISVISGTVLQFTGFVKSAVSDLPEDLQKLALSIKAVRYIGLLFLIPLFSSLSKGRLHMPWFLVCFFIAGLLFSYFPFLSITFGPFCKTLLLICWSTTMAAIGLNADLMSLFTGCGLKAFIISFVSFMLAILVFVGGISMRI